MMLYSIAQWQFYKDCCGLSTACLRHLFRKRQDIDNMIGSMLIFKKDVSKKLVS